VSDQQREPPAPDDRADEPDAPDADSEPPPDATMEMLFRVVRVFLPPFLFSWMLAYAGSQFSIDWIFYTGMCGVGVAVIGLLLWLLHH
jgi:hypothetical protein